MKPIVKRVLKVKWLLIEITLRLIVIRAEEEKETNVTTAICDKVPSFCTYIKYSRSNQRGSSGSKKNFKFLNIFVFY